MARETKPQNRTRWLMAAIAAMAGGVVIVVFLGVWWAVGGVNALGPRTVEDLLAASSNVNPVEATNELCADPVCAEGWRTDLGSYLRFDSAGEAEYWATVLGADGRRFDSIVLDMRDTDLTFEQRRAAIDTLFATRDWS